jgi:hypothetical protein
MCALQLDLVLLGGRRTTVVSNGGPSLCVTLGARSHHFHLCPQGRAPLDYRTLELETRSVFQLWDRSRVQLSEISPQGPPLVSTVALSSLTDRTLFVMT